MYTFETKVIVRVWLKHREANHPCPSIPYNNGKLPTSIAPHKDWFDWWLMSRKERKRLKENYMRTITTSNEAGTLSTTFIPFNEMANEAPPKLKETKMYHTNDPHASMREHLHYRLDRIVDDKQNKLADLHGINDDPAPKSGEELVKRIKDGHFIPRDEKKFNEPNAYMYAGLGVFSSIRWRKPDHKEDTVGYKAAIEELHTERTRVNDSIAIHEPAKALEELRKFEDKKLH